MEPRRQRAKAPRRGVVGSAWGLLAVALLALASAATGAGPPHTDRPWTRSELHIKVLMSALTYERSLQHSDADALHIGVLFDPGNGDSLITSTGVLSALERQTREMTFRGRPVIVSGIPLVDSPRMRKAIEAGIHVLYLTDGISETKLARVLVLTRELKIISVTGVEAYVRRGVTLGAVVKEGRPHVLIHYGAAQAEGAEFSSQLLQLAEIIGRPENHDD